MQLQINTLSCIDDGMVIGLHDFACKYRTRIHHLECTTETVRGGSWTSLKRHFMPVFTAQLGEMCPLSVGAIFVICLSVATPANAI